MTDLLDNWVIQVRKGILELAVLTALSERECYAYELVKSLISIPGLGVTEGTLYPLLSRLRMQGLILSRLEESSEGPARKYYRLSDEGRQTWRLMKHHLETILQGILTLSGGKGSL